MKKSKKILIALLSLVIAFILGGIIYTLAAPSSYVLVSNNTVDEINSTVSHILTASGYTGTSPKFYSISDIPINYGDTAKGYLTTADFFKAKKLSFAGNLSLEVKVNTNHAGKDVYDVDSDGDGNVDYKIYDATPSVTITFTPALQALGTTNSITFVPGESIDTNSVDYQGLVQAIHDALFTDISKTYWFNDISDKEYHQLRVTNVEKAVNTTVATLELIPDYDFKKCDFLAQTQKNSKHEDSNLKVDVYSLDISKYKPTWEHKDSGIKFTMHFTSEGNVCITAITPSGSTSTTTLLVEAVGNDIKLTRDNSWDTFVKEVTGAYDWLSNSTLFLDKAKSFELVDALENTDVQIADKDGNIVSLKDKADDLSKTLKNHYKDVVVADLDAGNNISNKVYSNGDIFNVTYSFYNDAKNGPCWKVTFSDISASVYVYESTYDIKELQGIRTSDEKKGKYVDALNALAATLGLDANTDTWTKFSTVLPDENNIPVLKACFDAAKDANEKVNDCTWDSTTLGRRELKALYYAVNGYSAREQDKHYENVSAEVLQAWTDVLNTMNTAVKQYLIDHKSHYDKQCLTNNTVPIWEESRLYPFKADLSTSTFPSKANFTELTVLGNTPDTAGSASDFYNSLNLTTSEPTFENMSARVNLAMYLMNNVDLSVKSPVGCGCDYHDFTDWQTLAENTKQEHDLDNAKGVCYKINTESYLQNTDFVDIINSCPINGLSSSTDFYTTVSKKDFAESWHTRAYGFYVDTLAEYFYFADVFRKECENQLNGGSSLTAEQIATLSFLEVVYNDVGKSLPALESIAKHGQGSSTTDTEYSLEELFELPNVEPYDGDPIIYDDENFQKNLDKTSPLGDFYITNSLQGYASIDREAIWNETSGFQSAEDVNSAILYKDGVEDTVGLKSDENVMDFTGSEFLRDESDISVDFNNSMDIGYSQGGLITSSKAVTMSDYIIEGMTYSSTYVPMRTNLYDPITLNNYSEEFKKEFFYKYGFMRKALLWDKSATSVVDFINANNKLTNTLEVVTLRDLLEAPNDVSLYVDDDFYNAEEAIEYGNTLLTARIAKDKELAEYLDDYYYTAEFLVNWAANVSKDDNASAILGTANIRPSFFGMISNLFSPESEDVERDELQEKITSVQDIHQTLLSQYNFNIDLLNMDDAKDWVDKLVDAITWSESSTLNENVLKDNDNINYSTQTQSYLTMIEGYEFTGADATMERNYDNLDSIVLPSSLISDYMDGKSMYMDEREQEDSDEILVQMYETYDTYNPMLSLAYVSAIYRDSDSFSLANAVASDNPVFLASKDAIQLSYCTDWYSNTLLNYCLVKNLKSASQIDYSYVMDMDCPLYIDVFGNITTESGLVVIPAASNMTLHNASYKDSHISLGLYSVYGNSYVVPWDLTNASKVMLPFFAVDVDDEVYVIDGKKVTLGEGVIKFNEISPYDAGTQKAIMQGYRSYIQNGAYTNLNWVAMVNVCNEVMRGAPIDSIDKEAEQLNVTVNKNKAGIVAAVKLENLIKSLEGMTSNTLIKIPDFSRMDDMEYLVAFLIKMILIATTAVIIVGVYRDGVSGELGIRTFWKSISGVALTFSAICLIPAIFQLTYYASNKFLLQEEAFTILMYNQEKYESGAEIDMLEISIPENTSDMSIQLDWISVPWYRQLENMLYGSTLQHLDETKKEAYLQAPIADNYDVELYNDGVYTTCEELFHSVELGYTWYPENSVKPNAIWLRAENDLQTASFYSPYYAFLKTLVANVNEYNQKFETQNFTTKYQSGNRLKTVGLCNAYFTSKTFMEYDVDIMHLYEMYSYPMPEGYDHVALWTPGDTMAFEASGWYNPIEDKSFDKRVDLMNKYARDFIAEHQQLLTKVTDETFIEVMALYMSVKYNQLFGIPAANALEIYNLDSNDLLRLSIATTEDAVMNSPMGYSRYVYNLGGEPSVYAAAVLTVIMWLGSFIKPLCTVIVFVSVFVSIWWFRVVLRRPSANLWGYLITCVLLCSTNILHALILKVSTYLPNWGLPMLPCLLFIIVGQVVYLLLLSYVTGVSLKDWSNLGYTEYEKTARRIQRKLGKDSTTDMLSGRIKHHENNWDYYDDLVEQHRSRNA